MTLHSYISLRVNEDREEHLELGELEQCVGFLVSGYISSIVSISKDHYGDSVDGVDVDGVDGVDVDVDVDNSSH